MIVGLMMERLFIIGCLILSFLFFPTGNTGAFPWVSYGVASKKNTHMLYPCATIKTESAIQRVEAGLMDFGRDVTQSSSTSVQQRNQL